MAEKIYKNCVVPHCVGKLNSGDSIHLFTFPKNDELRNKWTENLDMDAGSIKSWHRICERHFERQFVGSRKLRRDAVPTIALGHERDAPNRNNYVLRRDWRRCCIKNCKSGDAQIVHQFPKDHKFRALWIKACGIPNSQAHSSSIFVCEFHFAKQYSGVKRLPKYAIPCTNLVIEEPHTSRQDEIFDIVVKEETSLHSFPDIPVDDAIRPKDDDTSFGEFEDDSFEEEIKYEIPETTPPETNKGCSCEHKWTKAYEKMQSEYISEISLLREKNEQLQAELTDLRHRAFFAREGISENALQFAQIITSKNRVLNTDERDLVQSLYLVSARTFEYMRNTLKFFLPSKTTILRWNSMRNVQPCPSVLTTNVKECPHKPNKCECERKCFNVE